MHELGVVFHIIKIVEQTMMENNLSVVDKIVLQIGEMSSVVPLYVEECYPAAVDGTRLENTKLEIEVLPATAFCDSCSLAFRVNPEKIECTECGRRDIRMTSGNEFILKEISGS